MENIKYCLYARKSSEADERQAMSIDSQIAEMTRTAEKEGIEIAETIKESKSAKESCQRTGFLELLKGLSEERFNAILTWAPDRLSRNAGDLGTLVDMMDKKVLVKIQTFGQAFTNTPDEKFLLMILCSQAKLENDNRAKNVKRGLRAKCEMGIRPGQPPIGYTLIRSTRFGEPSKIVIDEERAPFIKKAFEYLINGGLSGRQVWEYLVDEGFRTRSGKVPPISMIFRIFKDTYYYGEFEFPKGGGNWYKSNHEPIITKELFKKARKALKTSDKGKWGRKNFYFNHILKCGHCGSGISGESHINRHGKEYTYYKCNKHGGRKSCKSKYIREEKLVEQISILVDKVSLENIHLKRKIMHEVNKWNQLEKIRHGEQGKSITANEYVNFILHRGSTREKGEMLKELQERIVLKEGVIVVLSNFSNV
jgi:site-specific DNA recombinase